MNKDGCFVLFFYFSNWKDDKLGMHFGFKKQKQTGSVLRGNFNNLIFFN